MRSVIFTLLFISGAVFSYSQLPSANALSEFGLSFKPDHTFSGSSLKGWNTVGDADWQAQKGELIGKAKGSGGGWLVMDSGYQDVGFHALFKTSANSET